MSAGRSPLARAVAACGTAAARAAAVAWVLLAWALPAPAHDVPVDTRLHAFVKPEGERLHVLLRMPLGLLLNADLPKQGPGYLALSQLDEGLARALASIDREIGWYEGDQRLTLSAGKARIAPPTDTAFGSYDSARALIHGPPLPEGTYVFWNQGYLDAHLEYRIASDRSGVALDFNVAPALRDRVRLDVRYLLPGGGERAYELAPAGERVVLDPRWHQAAWTFLVWGFEHILHGWDHLLFLLCLVLPFRRLDAYLVGVVSAFTVAHSVTLIAAAYGLAPSGEWFTPLVETVIAASILYMAVENVFRPRLRRRWVASTLFGLVHGFGFSFLLQSQLQFAGSNLLTSLLAFNVGVELGQLLVLVVVLPLLAAWRAWKPQAERATVIVIGVLAGHVAWHWMVERAQAFQEALPSGAMNLGAWAAEGGALLVLAFAAGWLALRRRSQQAARKPLEPA